MRIALVALLLATLAVPAQARGKQGSGAQTQNTAEQQKKSREEEKAYKETLKRIPVQKPADPWGKMR
jgi:ribosomal protein L9